MEILQILFNILAQLVTVLGLPVLIVSLFLLIKQLKIQTNQDVYDAMLSIDQFLIEHHHLRDYLYENKSLPENNTEEFRAVMASADMMLTFFEHIVGQKGSMSKAKWMGWESYIRDVYDSSPAIQHFWKSKYDWYDAELKEILGS